MEDKLLHFIVCFSLCLGMRKLGIPMTWRILLILAIGLGKEIMDPVLSVGDLLADGYGWLISELIPMSRGRHR